MLDNYIGENIKDIVYIAILMPKLFGNKKLTKVWYTGELVPPWMMLLKLVLI